MTPTYQMGEHAKAADLEAMLMVERKRRVELEGALKQVMAQLEAIRLNVREMVTMLEVEHSQVGKED